MAVDQPYYRLETENGEFVDDPSEDALFELIGELNDSDNTSFTIEPVTDDPAWYASVSRLPSGAFEVEYRNAAHREHEVLTETAPDRVAHDLTVWLASSHRRT